MPSPFTPPLQALRPVLSVAMAVAAAHALGLHDAWWAAITAFMVMQANFGASLYRGAMRVVGTVCGAAFGFVLGPPMAAHPVAFVAVLGAAAWGGLFAALLLRHSYAWVLALVTFIMVMCEALSTHSAPTALGSFALERVANIVVGTLACIVVAGLTELHPRLAWSSLPVSFSPTPPSGANHRLAALHALNGAAAVVLLAIIAVLYDVRSFSQAMVTTLAVLVVPLGAATDGVVGAVGSGGASGAVDGASAFDPTASVLHRMAQRLAGCALAGALAFALLPLVDGKPVWCQLVLALGLWAGAWAMRGAVRWPYAATQFSVAFLMVFVQDRGWHVDTGPAAQRLLGVFAGIAVLTLVIYLLRPLNQQAGKQTRKPP